MKKISFDLVEWRTYYDMVKTLGQYLIDSRPDIEGNPPKFTISLSERKKIENEIKQLTNDSNAYLDRCGMKMPAPKWFYDRHDEETWASSDKFQFHHKVAA